MAMSCNGGLVVTFASPTSKVCMNTSISCSSSHISTPSLNEHSNDSTSNNSTFSYSRASPSERWPRLQLQLAETYPLSQTHFSPTSPQLTHVVKEAELSLESSKSETLEVNDETQEKLGRVSKTRVKKMSKLALKRAKDWRERVKFLTDRILGLEQDQFVADVLDDRKVQMTPTDFCFLVKYVGQENWQRALEVYEWLNLKNWYSPNARMLATILAVLGKANQEILAVEIFTRAEPAVGNTVQVYNAMMGVYARNGRFQKVQELLDLMRKRGCEPDLVSFNTLINARLKAGAMVPDLAIKLLNEVRRSGLRPDIITYNTLISACSRESNLEETMKVFDDMDSHNCQPDLWTYNAMISVYGRCGMAYKAEQLFRDLESKGFFPDAVTYNSLLYAFAREGNVDKVKEICEEMIEMGFGRDEMTYNTIIHMYGKQGQHELGLQLYKDMKLSGRNPDVVTYTVLIDSLGKANKIKEASNLMSEMLDAGVKPTVRTCSALICGYAKAGMAVEAEDTFNCMRKSGIRPDFLAYSVMLDILLRCNEITKAWVMYQEMVRDGFTPDNILYEVMLQALTKENKVEEIKMVVGDMKELCGMNLQTISSFLVKGECYDLAVQMLRLGINNGEALDDENLLSILSSYSSSGRHKEACEVLEFLKEHTEGPSKLITEALVVVLCEACQLDAALKEYSNARESGSFSRSSTMVYCKMGFPETAHCLINQAEVQGLLLDNSIIYVDVIEAYGKVKLWQKAESVVGNVRQRYMNVDRKIWNALIQAYAASGCYERARAVFNTMMRDGPSPTVDSINGLLEALVVDGRLSEIYVVIEELQDMGFKISKSSILLMLDAFAEAGNLFEVKKIYSGMKAAGYFPTMHLYRIMIRLFCKGKRVRDVEAIVSEMEEAGFKPDLSIWNSMLKLYSGIEDYKRTAQIYQQIIEAGLEPDEDTYNTLIIMYCRDRRPEEGLSLMHEMRKAGLEPKLDTFKSLISAFGKQELFEQAEELFNDLLLKGYKLDRSFYHTMMKIYRNSGNHSKAENLLSMMKKAGVKPTIATMHLLMNGDYNVGIQKLMEMKMEGLEVDHRIWTCFIRAASLSQYTSEAIVLLNALRNAGFDLPIRLMTEKSELLFSELESCLDKLEPVEDSAAFNFVNSLVDLLWAFEHRATASWVFQLAVKKNIYRHDVFRVADKDWGADFRKLSAGSALVALTLWLDHMQKSINLVLNLKATINEFGMVLRQLLEIHEDKSVDVPQTGAVTIGWRIHKKDASLQGYPESPKSVVLITGTSEYNMVSLNSTLKACLWEMGSPFLPCKTRSGLLVAKAHSLRMWLKDSPFCLDLELKNAPSLPELSSMQLIEGCFIRRGLVPAFKDITERLGLVRPKKFARLALLSDEKREKAIEADIEGGKEKLEKLKLKVGSKRTRVVKKLRKRKFIRRPLSNPK
ncbi:hypothetical protein GOBAR_AA17243 [Gossypium barbadense]|uniref:Pentacotripeptide-repeat region of PRORP domain-containing protein n=1 Tax=Gossypium barbadense TaxID=3634 RepID=A0A2P5XJB7_GOSBA|nr:hypothetical protein GOBAR_AA17243 [Gossypium barbadense]